MLLKSQAKSFTILKIIFKSLINIDSDIADENRIVKESNEKKESQKLLNNFNKRTNYYLLVILNKRTRFE